MTNVSFSPRGATMLLLAFAMGLSACSPLGAFDALVPKDGDAQQAAKNVSFGPVERQKLDIYRPAKARSDALQTDLPVIVFIHGGSWKDGSKDGYSFVGRALASRGFLVIVPNYRLVPDIQYPAFLQDNAAAVEWVIDNAAAYGGDPSRIVLVGHSAGAYNAAMLALDPRWLGNRRENVSGFVGLAGPYDFLPLDGPVTKAAFGNEPQPETTQPIEYASADDPPVLLLHGAKDTTVDPKHSAILRDMLSQAGAEVTLKTYPEVGHIEILTALSRPFRGKAPVLDDTAAFADAVTRPR
ncbi:Arylformamidase [Alteripontixanthobacter maritimus]|uniref:Arylformamidase n=1 Tax=Alteripontixanthobacter maritimus TaxID=2161824 RepID=A0A369Q2L6_9SPHN|nr:alpha/beta hydrolase [Alteripontixanthobacter maritimus]RDC59143.1 Arylformamidase [Alteripontixanthobacter maritimus]